jgi:hypothetical protein
VHTRSRHFILSSSVPFVRISNYKSVQKKPPPYFGGGLFLLISGRS